MIRHITCLTVVIGSLCGCSGDSSFAGPVVTPVSSLPSSPPPPPPPPGPSQAIGGAWTGTDDSGNSIGALVTESGELNWFVADTGEQGVGTATASGDSLTLSYTLVPEFGSTLFDGGISATCDASGTIQERQSASVSADCTTDLGAPFSSTTNLIYDPAYDRDSDLAVIAGNFVNTSGVVTTIAADGFLFAQEPSTGCVQSGQVGIIDAEYNLYDVSITYMSCLAPLDNFNGATISGVALIDDTLSPETIVFVLTGDIDGATVAISYTLPRT